MVGLRAGAEGDVLITQASGPECRFQHLDKRLGAVACTCNASPSPGKWRQGSLKLTGQPAQLKQWPPASVRDPVSRWSLIEEDPASASSLYTCTHMYIDATGIFIHKYTIHRV